MTVRIPPAMSLMIGAALGLAIGGYVVALIDLADIAHLQAHVHHLLLLARSHK